MGPFVIVYIGYEGIEEIVSVELDAKNAIARVEAERERIHKWEWPGKLWNRIGFELWGWPNFLVDLFWSLPIPRQLLLGREPKRICAMGHVDSEYRCVCQQLGCSHDGASVMY